MGRESLVFRGLLYNFHRHNISFLVFITYNMLEMSVTEAALSSLVFSIKPDVANDKSLKEDKC